MQAALVHSRRPAPLPGDALLSPLFAVLAAVANAAASVLQRKATKDQPAGENLSWQLVRHMLHRPVWFGGIAAVIAGFLLQAAALGGGKISVVEPILVLELPATLLLSAALLRSRMRAREWGSAAAMTAGLAGLLYALAPSSGSGAGIPPGVWAAATGLNLLLVVVAVGWARLRPAGAQRAALLGVATGCLFGLTAALIKGVTVAFSHGFTAVLTSWQLYAMIAAGVCAMFLLQSAMHAGRLLATQPGLTLSDPLLSVFWGVFVFGEQVRGGLYLVMAAVGAAVVTAAVVVLARSPLLSGEAGSQENPEETGADTE